MSGNLAEMVGIEVPTRLLIGGEWTGSRGGGTLPVIDPSTEDPLAEVADGTVEDALDAVSAAQDALAGWAGTPPRQRAECLRRAFELTTKNADALARLMVAENGKALRDAKGEAAYSAEFFRWYAEEAVRNIGQISMAPASGARIVAQHKPAGTPASSSAGISASMVSGVSEAGLSTTGQPAASAGPILRVAIAAGKFHGVTSTDTPTGCRMTRILFAPDGACISTPSIRTASSAYQRKNSAE